MLAGTGSVVPDAGVIVAVFDSVPVAEAATVAVSAKVIEPPTVMFTSVEIAPVPDATVHALGGVAVHVQATLVNVAGGVSLTVAPNSADGPRLVTSIV